ncbi:uncharacterized protein LOC142597950 [Dermatophagoides farinae]|uniref:uncharacterized protein LOC142597950 n=1 Tax=Dermatophagoides farinae TaxID=6954 RepID=UPI003F63F53E
MVPYPVQLTVKTVKSLPIIIGGRLFFGQKHKIEDYFYAGILLLLLNGLQPIWAMIEAGPRFALMLTIFLLTGSIGQMFIVRTLRSLGSLKLTLITTCRKFITILMSLMAPHS